MHGQRAACASVKACQGTSANGPEQHQSHCTARNKELEHEGCCKHSLRVLADSTTARKTEAHQNCRWPDGLHAQPTAACKLLQMLLHYCAGSVFHTRSLQVRNKVKQVQPSGCWLAHGRGAKVTGRASPWHIQQEVPTVWRAWLLRGAGTSGAPASRTAAAAHRPATRKGTT